MAKIFILEDDLTRMALFYEVLQPRHEIVHADNVEDALRYVAAVSFDLYLLDHDLGGEAYVNENLPNTGSGFCRSEVAQKAMANKPVLVHSYNKDGAANMLSLIKHATWIPFGKTVLDLLAVWEGV